MYVVVIARSSYASAVLGIVILSVYLSTRPSVTRVLCDKTKKHTVDIFIPDERVITLVSDINRGQWVMSHSTLNLH